MEAIGAPVGPRAGERELLGSMAAHQMAGRALELEARRGLLHALRQGLLDLAVASAQEIAHLVDGLTKISKLDLASKKAEQAEQFRRCGAILESPV